MTHFKPPLLYQFITLFFLLTQFILHSQPLWTLPSTKNKIDIAFTIFMFGLFIASNILMVYSLIKQFRTNNDWLQSSTVLFLLVIGGTLLTFGGLACSREYDRRSGRLKKDILRSKDYVVYDGIASFCFGSLYVLSFLGIGSCLAIELTQN